MRAWPVFVVCVIASVMAWAATTPVPETEATPTPKATPDDWSPRAPKFKILEHEESDYYPCMDCHEDEGGDPTPRGLEDMHDDLVLDHGPKSRWCMDCHNLENRDVLELASGELVDFTDSNRLCGQCHGDQLRDWRSGVHGKVGGNLFGEREFLKCVACHEPHVPRFEPIAPMEAPLRPEDTKRRRGDP